MIDDLTPATHKRLGDRFILAPVETSITEQDNGGPDIQITWDVVDGSLQCRRVVFTAPEGAREIRRSDLRAVGIDDLREHVAVAWSMEPHIDVGGGTWRADFPSTHQEATKTVGNLRSTRRRLDGQTLQRVAEIYSAADRAPTQAVADAFEVAHRTAGLYVRTARDKGLLPPPAGKRSAKKGSNDDQTE